MLPVPGGFCALAAAGIIGAKDVKQICDAERGDLVSAAVFVDEQRKIDSGFLLKNARVVAVTQTDGGEGSSFFTEGRLVFAQLRDVLAAKNSSVVAKKHDDGGT